MVLLVLTKTAPARASVAVYAISITGMLLASALYHRLRVGRSLQAWLRKIDHSMIGVAVAGTYTPVIALSASGHLRVMLLTLLWVGAFGAAMLALFAPHANRIIVAAVYVILGWAGIVVVPHVIRAAGVLPLVLMVVGGVLYLLGAVIYAGKRPNPSPAVFGFHELFHVFVVAAVISHFVAVAVLVSRTAGLSV